ncbi:hypothetical protein [Pseudomonas sp. B392_1p]|uniref:hypothetical protein n=1 Tax=Pseudomonas sp. B392_1p TaxID=3457507 RepID=UPI003FD148AE
MSVFVVDVKSDIHPTRLRVDPLYAYPRASQIDRVEFRGDQETVVAYLRERAQRHNG